MDTKGVRAVWDKYGFAILVMALGAGLMLWPTGQRTVSAETVAPTSPATRSGQGGAASRNAQTSASGRDLQEEMRETLGRIQGVGEVWVLLTVESDGSRILAENRKVSSQGDAFSESSETVLTDTPNGDSVVVTTTRFPTYRGALIVCEGGDSPAVRLAVTEAVTALTGLPANRVAVVKCQ